MSNRDWWRGSVIYRIQTNSVLDVDSTGGLPAINAKLEDLAELGVDAIWLAPFFASLGNPLQNHTDWLGVDPTFGSLDDFDEVLDRAHTLGLRVLLDLVWSYTSDRHAWFAESRADRTNERADWYIWADPARDGTPPKQGRSIAAGTAWSWEPCRRQYYLHRVASNQPVLNLQNEAVQDALLASAEFWLRRGVDGFRLDSVDSLMHDGFIRRRCAIESNPQCQGRNLWEPAGGRLLARVRHLTEHYPGCVTLGEVSTGPGAFDRVVAYTSGSALLHMAYTLRPLRGRFNPATVQQFLRDAAASGDDGWFCWCFTDGEAARALNRWNPSRGDAETEAALARLLIALSFSLRGSISVGSPWLPMPSFRPEAGFQTGEKQNLLRTARRFLAWRRMQPALVQGGFRVLAFPEPLVGFLREHEGNRVLAAFNLSDSQARLDLTDYAAVRPLPECGFSMEIDGDTAILPTYGVFFAAVVPAREWVEEAALAFA
ncbi:MAG: alpha-glucosidase [Acetobacteraceae bacterium]|nr:alpha-glucosidase [Acetobacteraceae bacterium]